MSIVTIKKNKILGSIYQQSVKLRSPIVVMFELTYRCNFRCPHCYVEGSPKKEKELSTKEVFLIIDQLREIGVFSIAFTGGEALLRKDIFEILVYAKRQGFETAILSNGYLIDKKIANKLLSVNINAVDITLNALKTEVFEKLTGVKDALKRVKTAIKLLIRRGINVKIKTTGMSINRDELVAIGEFARSLNIRYNLDCEVLPCRNGSTTAVQNYSLNPVEIQELRRKIYPEMFRRNGRKSVGPRRKLKQMFNCGVGKNSFSINPSGKMNFCLEIDYPNHDILKYGLKECWENIKREVDQLNNAPDFVCKSCALIKYCGWCAGRSYLETGTFNKCSEFCKTQAIGVKKWKRKDRVKRKQ